MAANDSSSRDLDKRTRELDRREVRTGRGLEERQLAQNQLQAIQDERRNNLMTERAIEQQVQGTNQVLAQAGEMVAASQQSGGQSIAMLNPQTQGILSKYQGAPKVQRTQGREVKVTPNNITINNNYKTETINNVNASGGGPVQGRPVVIRDQGGGTDGNQAKFKAWLGGIFNQQKQESLRREKEFDRREWSLTKSANKMLRRIEVAGKDIVDNMNPRVIGTTIRSQFQTLLFIFGARFLAKHWTKVLDIFVKVSNGVKSALDYFGITSDGKRLAASGQGFRGDIISFFGGNPRNENLLTVFKKLGTELVDYLKKRFDDSMEERGAAIKAIKFPKLDLSNMATTLTGISGYLADILTAMVDPRTGIQNSLARGIKNAGIVSSNEAARRDGNFENQTIIKNTDMGDYAVAGVGKNGRRKYSLLKGAVDSGGELKDYVAGEISQGRDILGAINDARTTGKLDTARLASGFNRMQENADKTGGVIVDDEFIKRMFGSSAGQLIQSGQIKPIRMKYVQVKKTEDDYANQNARGLAGGTAASAVEQTFVNMVPGSDGNLGTLAKIVGNEKYRTLNKGAKLTHLITAPGTIIADEALNWFGGDVGRMASAGVHNMINRAWANNYKLALVPEDDPRPAAIGRTFTYFNLTPQAIKALSVRFTRQKEFNLKSSNQFQALQRTLVGNAGGEVAVNARFKDSGLDGSQKDYDASYYNGALKDFDNLQSMHKAQQESMMPTWSKFGNNILTAGNNAIGAVNSGMSWISSKLSTITDAKKATFAFDYVPKQPSTRYHDFDVQSAVRTLRSNAKSRSTGYCAVYVTAAIGSGLHLGSRPQLGDAKELSGRLGELGFAPVSWEKYYPQAGDIYVCPEIPGHVRGHTAMFDGDRWISDYNQVDIWGGSGMRHYKKGVIFRHISQFGVGSSYDSGFNIKNGTEQDGNYDTGSYSVGGSTYYGTSFSIPGSGNVPMSSTPSSSTPLFGGGDYTVNYSIPQNLSGDRAKFWDEHKSAWSKVLKSRGFSNEDVDRLSGFFTAQDGFESDAGTSAAARQKNNFGGMQSGGKNISYKSKEDYMNAKLDMMLSKFSSSLGAETFDKFILSLGRTGHNRNGYLYYTEDPERYIRGAASFYKGKYGGSGQVSFNPLLTKYDKGVDDGIPAVNAPQIDFRFNAKSKKEMSREIAWKNISAETANLFQKYPELKEIFPDFSDFARYWTKKSSKERQKLIEGINAYHNHKKAILANEETSGMGVIDFAEAWTKSKNGWEFVKRWEKNNTYNMRSGFGKTFVSGNSDWMLSHMNSMDSLSLGKSASLTPDWMGIRDKELVSNVYNRVMRAEKFEDYNDRLGAGILFGSDYMNLEKEKNLLDKKINKAKKYRGSSPIASRELDALNKKRDSIASKIKYYEDAASGFMREASGKDKKARQHTYSKWKEVAGLGNKIEDIIEKKREADVKYSLMINDIANQDPKTRAKIIQEYMQIVGDLENQRIRLSDRMEKIKASTTKEEARFIKETAERSKILDVSTDELQASFNNAYSRTRSYFGAIQDMVQKYGEVVLEELTKRWNLPKLLTKDDFKTGQDFEGYVKTQSDLHKKYPYATYSPDVVVSTHQILHNRGAIKDSEGLSRSYKYTTIGKDYQLYKGGNEKAKALISGGKNYITLSSEGSAGKVIGNGSPSILYRGHASGGYTEDGPTTKVAGIVHAGEWVAPKWMVKSSKFKPVFSALEKERLEGRKKESSVENTPDVDGGNIIKIDPILAEGQARTNQLLQQLVANTSQKSMLGTRYVRRESV